MFLRAQAVAEYGGIAPRGGGPGTADQILRWFNDASPMDYALVGGGVLLGLFLILKLLDAA